MMKFNEYKKNIEDAKKLVESYGYKVIMEGIEDGLSDDDYIDPNDNLDQDMEDAIDPEMYEEDNESLIPELKEAIENGEIDAVEFATTLIDALDGSDFDLNGFCETHGF